MNNIDVVSRNDDMVDVFILYLALDSLLLRFALS